MCGFCGFSAYGHEAELDEASDDRTVIHHMADAIAHRGPDDDGYFVDDHVALGFRRLSIIDLSLAAQPMTNQSETLTLLFNGEIYNYQDLRAELQQLGYVFQTNGDSETLLHGYDAWGKDLLGKLRGMYAFAIYDHRSHTIFGARDIFGIKPLYLYNHDGLFLFGSEVKSFLRHPGFKKEFDESLLPAYLSFEFIPDTRTLFKHVTKLLPGSWFEFNDGVLTTEPFTHIEFDIDDSKTMDEAVAEIRSTLADSVAAHKISDVEVGSFLSSGIDSSYVLNEASKTYPIKSFSVGYENSQWSELPYSTEFSKTIGVPNTARTLDADDFFSAVPAIQWFMDEPLSNPSAIPLYYVAQTAAEQVKVVLSGEGADELFGGYNQYSEPLTYTRYEKIPLPIRRAIAGVARHLPRVKGRRFLIRGAQKLEDRYVRINYVFDRHQRDALLKHPETNFEAADLTRHFFDESKGQGEITQMQYFDLQTWIIYDILLKADRMSMANSLELRVPFLDKKMLAVAMSLPERLRVTRENTKIALRTAARAELPELTANKKKLGFPSPLYEWMREEKYAAILREAFDSPIAEKFFNRDYLRTMLDEHVSGKTSHMQQIWSIYSFVVWYSLFFAEDPASQASSLTRVPAKAATYAAAA